MRVTTVPPAGAGPLRVTVPVELDPPVTDAGDSARLTMLAAGLMVNVAVWLRLLSVPVIVALVIAETAVVVTVKVAVVAPAATVTEAGGTAFVLVELNATTAPPVGAAPLRVTVPVDEAPPTREVGASVSPVIEAGLIVSVPFWEAPPCVPVIVAVTTLPTAVVVIWKVAVVAPAGTVTLPWTGAFVLLEVNVTPTPPVAAGPERVTVPVAFAPPCTEAGEIVRLSREGELIVKVADSVCPLSAAEMVADFAL